MIEETAIVIDVNEQQVLLQTQRKSACQSCSVKSGCGTSVLSKVVGKRSSRFTVEKSFDVESGDRVIIAIDENALVQGSLLIYLFPLVFMMLVGITAEYLFATELMTILFVVLSFVCAMFFVRFVISVSTLKKSVQPHIVRRA